MDIKKSRENTENLIRILLETKILSEDQKKEFMRLNNMRFKK